jgi:hypothetical protein
MPFAGSPDAAFTPLLVSTPAAVGVATITQMPESSLRDIFQQGNNLVVFQYDRTFGERFSSELTTDVGCKHSGQYGMRFTYSMQNSEIAQWGIKWLSEPLVVSATMSLVFWVKGATGAEKFDIRIGTRFADLVVGSQQFVEVSNLEWRMANIPLKSFAANSDVPESLVDAIQWLFFRFGSSDSAGSICIDDISFAP